MTTVVEKMTYDDVRHNISQNLVGGGYVTDVLINETSVIIEKYSETTVEGNGGYRKFKYSYNPTTYKIDPNSEKEVAVVRDTTFKEVSKSSDSWLTEKFIEFVKKFNGEHLKPEHEVVKSLDEEKMISVEVFYCPPGEADSHGDGIEDIEVLKSASESFNKAIAEGRAPACLFHSHKTNAYEYITTYVIEKAMDYEGDTLPEGTMLIELQWKNPKAWELRKQGVLCGGSMRGWVSVEE